MVKFVFEDTVTTIRRLAEWMKTDPFHQEQEVDPWYRKDGTFLVACWVYDDVGPVMFLRADAEGEYVRLHIQFGPVEQISRLRQARAIMKGWPSFVDTVTVPGVKGIIFNSINPSLVTFMKGMGFEDSKDANEYLLVVQER